MEILAIVLKLFGSSSVGSMIGWVGGLLNRKVDLEARRIEIDLEKAKLAQELQMRDKDAAIMQLELAGKERIAVVQTEGAVDVAAYGALAESYKHDQSIEAGPRMMAFTKFVRPFTTLTFLFASQFMLAAILWSAFVFYDVRFEQAFWAQLVLYAVEWEFFQAALCIGWWFANRPSGRAPGAPQRGVGAA